MLLTWSAAFAGAAECGACHVEAYAAWRSSRHASAVSNPVFTASWEHWPNGWCLTCHAPREQQQIDRLGYPARPGVVMQLPDEPPGSSWKDGVDCEACHAGPDGLRTANPPTKAGQEVHALVHDPTLTSTACGSCHEFNIQQHTPRFPFAYGQTLAQATLTEWRATGSGPCADCHFEGHAFVGAHEPELVREAVSIEREGLTFTIRTEGIGHSFPTGDPFRRLELQLCTDATEESCTTVAWFRRALEPTATSWRVASDTRIHAGEPRTVTVEPMAGATRWELRYFYGDRRFEAKLPTDEVGFVVGSGKL